MSRRRGMRWLRSIRVQAFALGAILITLPILISAVLGDADAERRLLVLNAVAETGDAIAAGLAPVLHDLRPADIASLRQALSQFAAEERSIKILFRPEGVTATANFYLVATEPPISSEQTEAERQQLLGLGILPELSQGCVARFMRGRNASLLSQGNQVLTSVTSVEGSAGCWAIVIATSESRILGAIEPQPYWTRPEIRAAIAIYALMALLIVAIFASVWRGLLRFRRLALSPTERAGFASVARVPELASLAVAFDSMVQRMRRSAEMLRQAAEDNAHAFKGPIGTIRQVIEPPLRAASHGDAALRGSLETVSSALDRLDGLVQSARYLDSATAELLEPEQSPVDLSALVRGFMESSECANAMHRVQFDTIVADDVVVTGQAEALETILENLVDNAISFAPVGGRVGVRLERQGAQAIVSVEDNGSGVAPDRLDRIFDRYYTHRPAKPDGGVATQHFGIGLWQARQNARALGGEITAGNRVPYGLRVTVILPVARV